MASGNVSVNNEGRLPDNITAFGGVLRRAGMNVGTASIVDAVEATKAVGVGSKDDLYWTLHSVMVNRREDHPTFDEAFRIFFGNIAANKILSMMSPTVDAPKKLPKAAGQRVAEALGGHQDTNRERVEIEVDASLSMSPSEILKTKDFGMMTTEELVEARKAIQKLVLEDDNIRMRRYVRKVGATKKFDVRATMRNSTKSGDFFLPQFAKPRTQSPPVVVLADISGSMSAYTKILLHFVHALATQRKIHAFLFGTRLTNITRAMKHKDPDEAIRNVAEQVVDWEGGTRIGETIQMFNREWGRRVLGQGAVVLFVSDGLERANNTEEIQLLEYETSRLKRSCRRLIWLNPLLRFDKFEPKAAGIKAILPNVDELRAVHSLNSLEEVCAAISQKRFG